MLRWLKINRYRNVLPGTELTFSDGHHVLLGPNGGGKTTLLELIAAVLRGDFSGLKEEDFSIEYSTTHGSTISTHIRLTHEQRSSPQSTAAPEWMNALSATLQHSALGTKHINLTDGVIQIDGIALMHENPDLTAPLLHTRLSLLCWTESSLESFRPYFDWLGVFRFDEALSFFSFVRGIGDVGGKPYVSVHRSLPDHPPHTSFQRHPLFDPVCAAMVDALKKPGADSDRITLPLSSLGAFSEVVSLLGFQSGVFRADLEREVRTDDRERLTYERFQFRFVRRDGTMVLDEHLSFGQKRLLAFLFYAWANDGPIVADELVDGMHYRWIEHCLKTIRGRQAFLSSQNPLLMDFIGFDSAEKVQQTFVICDVEESDGRERMRWRNLTADEAGDFFNAYEVGIQHVSEILRDKGLW